MTTKLLQPEGEECVALFGGYRIPFKTVTQLLSRLNLESFVGVGKVYWGTKEGLPCPSS